jgi:hypothetical protein
MSTVPRSPSGNNVPQGSQGALREVNKEKKKNPLIILSGLSVPCGELFRYAFCT